MDVLFASSGDDDITFVENEDGAGTFDATRSVVLGTGDGASSVIAADVDGDGDMDIVAAFRFDGYIMWYENIDGVGDFAAGEAIAIEGGPNHVVAADFDADGDFDLVCASFDSGRLVWFENLRKEAESSSSLGASSTAVPGATVEPTNADDTATIPPVTSPSSSSSLTSTLDGDGTGEKIILLMEVSIVLQICSRLTSFSDLPVQA